MAKIDFNKVRIQASRKRVEKAQQELKDAGAALLKAIKASPEELDGGKDSLLEIYHEVAEPIAWAGAEWNQMLAEHILDDRESRRRAIGPVG